ncbi:Serine-threonine/tyrosine-protein kinase, catalytic domain [Dillenia turbinata]|uniref:Serine-threonine/tyrosine-protein kinase, catalytic domain n=1 Tax=Dillenia turbinata TaxID=194707 RepID=A0AAN8UWZ5_9MAGN
MEPTAWRLVCCCDSKADQGDQYDYRRPNGICNSSNKPYCQRLKGFVPEQPSEWNKHNYRSGCVRRKPLNCTTGKDGFQKFSGVKLPDTSYLVDRTVLSLVECEEACLNNCSCVAYAQTDFTGCAPARRKSGSNCSMICVSGTCSDMFDQLVFKPRFKEEWSRGNWTGGCVRRTELGCAGNSSGGLSSEKEEKDGFWRLHDVKLPDFSLVLEFDNAKECEEWCLDNCSCLAYAYVVVLRCMVWTTDLIDTQQHLVPGGPDLFLRLAHSDLGGEESRKVMEPDDVISERHTSVSQGNQPELPQFMFNTIVVATENFSITNKLGEGGFGTVYKGKLIDEQEIAVKRLSNTSGQGVHEFKNEIILISKLQHRNLVKLLGYCIEEDEKILIYEYMPNKSLDTSFFGQLRNPFLEFSVYSYIFSAYQEVHGYMSPEYAMGGIFSEKSDVFSFGVLLLEILSSRKNTSVHFYEQSLNLAWCLWNEAKALELMDRELVHSYCASKVWRCIHIALLCVQNHAKDRPTMSEVVLMLSSETDRPQPKEPGYAFKNPFELKNQGLSGSMSSHNNMTLSLVETR